MNSNHGHRMRVGVVSLYHESNSFLPTRTTLMDFRKHVLLGGEAVRERFAATHHEIAGFFDGLTREGIEAVPVFAAWATPSGVITADTLDALLEQMFRELAAAGPLDGVLVAPHGAAVSENVRDVDGRWLTRLREHVGPHTPVIGTLDPHANVSRCMVDATDALIAYRTNPHLDQHARGREAAALMARTLRGEVRPVQAAAFPPVAINIERQLTAEPPCRDLYDHADALARAGGLLSSSVLLGFPYADVEEMGSGFIAVANGDPTEARRVADNVGTYLLQHREAFRGELLPIDAAIDRALAGEPPACLLDMGDNVGGGGPGDGTLLAHALHARRLGPAFVCLYDPHSAAAACAAGAGVRLVLSMGGKTDNNHGAPLETEVRVISVHDGRFAESEARHGGMTHFDMGPTAVVETDAQLVVMLTSERVFPVSLVQLTACGLDPVAFRVILAKGVHAPVAAYVHACPTMIRVSTPGVTTADMTALTYQHRRRPLFPFEAV